MQGEHFVQDDTGRRISSLGVGGGELGEGGLDGVALAGHVEFAEEGEGLLEFLFLGGAVAALTCQVAYVPIRVTEIRFKAELNADGFFLL